MIFEFAYQKYNISRILFGCFIFLFPLWEREYIAAEYHVVPICILFCIAFIGYLTTLLKGKVCISATDIFMFICGLYLWLHYMSGEIHSISYAIHLMYFGLLYVIGRGLSSVNKAIGVYAVMAAGMLQAVFVWLQYLHISPSHHAWFTCTGSYSNPALCATMIALSFIAGIYMVVQNNIPKTYKRIMMFFYLPFMVSALILIDSRASWLAVGITGVWMFMDKKAWSIRRKWATGILLLFIIIPPLYLYRPQSANSRLFIWRVCTEIIKDNPIIGNGPQAVQRYYMPYQAQFLDKETDINLKTQATNNTYSFNEYLRILCEYGCVGMLLFIGLICSLRKDTVYGYLLSVLLVVAFFSYPSFALSLASLFMLFVGASSSKPFYSFTAHHRLAWGIMGIIALLLIPYVWLYHKTDMALGKYFWSVEHETFLDKNYKYFRNETGLVSRYAKVLFYAEEYEKAIPVLERLTQLSPTSSIFCDLGVSNEHVGNLSKAEECYQYIVGMVPGYVTPPYRLFRLYLGNGDSVKALRMAHHIVSQPVKVNNSFTINAKNEAGKFIEEQELKSALRKAGGHRIELERVIQHYDEFDKNEEKKRAACYLITNMVGHCSYNDKLLDAYADRLSVCDWDTPKDKIYKIWDSCYAEFPNPSINFDRDMKTISAEYLIDNIDHSYKTWKNTPWHHQISFETYCKYILPYRVNTERLSDVGWRDSLYNRFHSLIEKETDVKKAFAIISQHITHHFRNTQPSYPREMDALSIGKIRPGNCSLRCIYTIYVLRALGIPACYDFVEHWSNYSTRGHAWVALVTHPDSTFTLHKGDSVPLYHNRIDGSVFMATMLPETDYPYPLDSVKRVAQVFRFMFEDKDNEHSCEVTSQYGMNRSWVVKDAPIKNGFCDISIFLTGKDWSVIKTIPVNNHRACIEHLGYDQLYLLTYRDDVGNVINSYPAIFHSNGQLEYLKGNKKEKETVVAYRKYPLFIHQTETWCKMKGCIIEASHTKDFKNAETLLEVSKTPFRFFFHSVSPTQAYRYVRYKSTNRWGTALAEFEVYDKDKEKLQGKPIGCTDDTKLLANGVDGNYHTFVTSNGGDYWYGLDLGPNPPHIEQVRFLPKNDANYIEPGHTYEMLYYDNQWISLGTQTARCDSLVYEIPANSLTLVKDLTAGKEERPFVYKENTPQWW